MISPVTFWILAVIVIGSALLVVTFKNIFHAALALVITFLGVAGYYLVLRADFLAITQILIYAGAIAVLILFAILMTHRVGEHKETVHNSLKIMSTLVIAPLLALITVVVQITFPLTTMMPQQTGSELAKIGERLLISYALPFEIISLILLAAMIGAIIVGREEWK